jgi:butyrate kinase
MGSTDSHIIFAINPGSTSTKLALARGGSIVDSETLHHDESQLKKYPRVWDQYHFRRDACKQWAAARTKTCSAVVSRGGLLRPLPGGTYSVNDLMLRDAHANLQGEHVSNLSCHLASQSAADYRCPAFVVDPVSVDEFADLARYSGHPLIERRSLSHALSIHATARKAARKLGKPYEQSSFVVAHMGGGISIAPVLRGKIIDANDAASDGPFSAERTGGLPLQQFISLCMSGKYAEHELRSMVMGNGGLMAYLGSNNALEIERRILEGDEQARRIYEAMAYQIAKEIGAMATVVRGSVDAVVLTGGLAQSVLLVSWLKRRVEFIARVMVIKEDNEMEALVSGAVRVLQGEERAKEY